VHPPGPATNYEPRATSHELRATRRRRAVRCGAAVLVILILASGFIGGLYRSMKERPDPDWRSLQRESTHVWQHRSIPTTPAMFGYLPTTFFALWPVAVWLPKPVGAIVFVSLNVLAAVASWLILYRWWFSPSSKVGRATFVWPILITVCHFQHVLQANQLTIWVLLLCVGGLTLLMHRHQWLGGLLLGLAGCLKVTPFVFLGYLILRGQWKGFLGMLLAVVLFDVVPSVVFLGADGAVHEHRLWLQRVQWYSNRQMIEHPYLRLGRHGLRNNCSYSVVLARWLRPRPEYDVQIILRGDPPEEIVKATAAELKPGEHLVFDPAHIPGVAWKKQRAVIPDVPRSPLAAFSARTVLTVWAATLAIAVGILFFVTRRSRREAPGNLAWCAEASLWMLLMLWISPLLRDYYLPLALPACVVIWQAVMVKNGSVARARIPSRTPRGRMAAFAALGFFCVGFAALAVEALNWYGLHIATLAGLAAASGWVWYTSESRRRLSTQSVRRF